MLSVLQVGNRTITAEEIIPLLASYQILPQLLRELLIDQAIASFTCTPEETASACQQFFQQHQLTSQTALQTWLAQHRMTLEQLQALGTRRLSIEKFKQVTWKHKLESYFLQRKGQLDKVIYSLIRTQDVEIAQELYFQIQEKEQSFAELARQYSQGSEAETGGLIGPVQLSTPHPTLAQMLSVSQPGKLCPPTRLGKWLVIVRLEKFIPVQLDEPMRQQLLDELFETWLQQQLQQLGSIHPLPGSAITVVK